jgi:hypothetical protein
VQPRPGDCSKFLAHLRDNVSRGDEAIFSWVVGWFAAIVQHPERKVGTSLVIRGKEGTGKTKVGAVFGSILGAHYLSVSDPRYVTGRFNSHLTSCLLLHAEEAFWAGDRAAEGKLKDLITGDDHLIEFKGKEPIRIRNFARLLVTGNPDWVVPVALEGRRFGVLEIGEGHREDHTYFAAIDSEMQRGGREALLHHLLSFDLSTVELHRIPKTAALLDQKFASLTPENAWWLDVLQSGRLPYGTEENGTCPTNLLFNDYIQHAQKIGTRHKVIATRVGMFLQKHAPGLRKRERTYRTYNGNMETGMVYEFPHLELCRAAFVEKLGQPITWDGPTEWLPEPEPRRDPEGQPF